MKNILRLKMTSDFLLMIIFYVFCLNSSTAIAQQNNLKDLTYKTIVLEKIGDLLETKYVLPEMAKKYADDFRKGCEKGKYKSYINSGKFAEQITADLIRITNDKHINFRVITPSNIGEKPESSLHHPIRYHQLGIIENKGFSKLEWLEGNIGYLDIRRFYYFPDIKDRVIAIIKFLSNADAIIIDLRENGGGSGDYLSNYFLDYQTQLTSWYYREDDFLKEFWTSEETSVKRLVDVPLFILTSQKTFSAAESFAYDMKVRKRATIIGDSTKGGAHSVDLYKIDDQFEIYISTARAINPITGDNWEVIGVVPDIFVAPEFALDTAIILAMSAGERFAEVRESKLKIATEQMQNHMVLAEKLFNEDNYLEANARLDSVFKLADECELINEFFIDVLAYNYSSLKDEQIQYAIFKKKIELFPNSSTSYERLAYAYYNNKKNKLAISYFEKVLELDPNNRNAMKMIKRLQNKL